MQHGCAPYAAEAALHIRRPQYNRAVLMCPECNPLNLNPCCVFSTQTNVQQPSPSPTAKEHPPLPSTAHHTGCLSRHRAPVRPCRLALLVCTAHAGTPWVRLAGSQGSTAEGWHDSVSGAVRCTHTQYTQAPCRCSGACPCRPCPAPALQNTPCPKPSAGAYPCTRARHPWLEPQDPVGLQRSLRPHSLVSPLAAATRAGAWLSGGGRLGVARQGLPWIQECGAPVHAVNGAGPRHASNPPCPHMPLLSEHRLNTGCAVLHPCRPHAPMRTLLFALLAIGAAAMRDGEDYMGRERPCLLACLGFQSV